MRRRSNLCPKISGRGTSSLQAKGAVSAGYIGIRLPPLISARRPETVKSFSQSEAFLKNLQPVPTSLRSQRARIGGTATISVCHITPRAPTVAQYGRKRSNSRRFESVPALDFPLLPVLALKSFTSRNSGFSHLQSM